jgi:uncharacterized protein YpmB
MSDGRGKFNRWLMMMVLIAIIFADVMHLIAYYEREHLRQEVEQHQRAIEQLQKENHK